MTKVSKAVPIYNGAAILTSWETYMRDGETRPTASLLIVKGSEADDGVMPAASISLGMDDIASVYALLHGYFEGLKEVTP
jgi:hypothetical protein